MAQQSRLKYIVLLVCTLMLVSGATLPASRIIEQATLTPEGGRYGVMVQGTRLTVHNVNSGENNREIYWNERTPESPSAVQCATWTSGIDVAQHGFAFRIARQSGGVNAIVFARNIWLRQHWVFAPKLFHTGSDYAYERVSPPGITYLPGWDSPTGIDLGGYLGRTAEVVYPLRVCASLDEHDVLRFAVAKGVDPMPPLDRPGLQGGSWQLDIAGSYHAGDGLTGKNGGIFAGHVPASTMLAFDDMTLNGRPLPVF